MSVKIIAENLIEKDHFLSATEQEGIYIGQPIPDAANTGSLRPIAIGDENGTINDIDYDGTVSGRLTALTYYDFECAYTAGLAAGWSKLGASQTYTEESTIVHDGVRAQKVACVADGETIGVAQSFLTVDTSLYQISAWVYCNENTTVTIAHANLVGNSDTFAVNATTWTECVWEVAADASGAADLQIYRAIADSDVADYIIIDQVVADTWNKNNFTDDTLMFFGANCLIGASIELTSGTNDGETFTVNANLANGYVQFPTLATEYIKKGDTYTLTLAAKDLDMKVELMTSGNVGDAKFKWYFDGGTEPIGREYVPSSEWHKEIVNEDVGTAGGVKVVEMSNGNLLCAYNNEDDDLVYRTSANQGITWSAQSTIEDDDDFYMYDVIVLESGRILIFAGLGAGLGTDKFYSDDNANTWSDKIHMDPDFKCVIELANGNLLGFNDENDDIRCQVSSDEGATWGSEITIVAGANDQVHPSATIAANGDIVCVYETDEDAVGDLEIECKISTDNGATWGSAISVEDYGASSGDKYPWVVTYPSGDLSCYMVSEVTAGNWNGIVESVSTDNGATWAGASVVLSTTSLDKAELRASVTYGARLWIGYRDEWTRIHCALRHNDAVGDSVLYGIITGVNALNQQLYCDVNLKWFGNSGVAGDFWTFTPEWIYAASNIINTSPDETYRSENDNIACNMVIGTGANERYICDGVAFFNSNVRTIDFQMNATDSWGSPTLDSTVSFDVTTAGVVDSVAGNFIEDAALLNSYKDHELKELYLRMLDGADSGLSWKIKDNQGDYIQLDTTAAHSISATDTFAIFGTKIAKTFTENVLRYIRLLIDAQQTAEDYYQLGGMIAGKVITLSKAWLPGHAQTLKTGTEFLRPMGGGIVNIQRNDVKSTWSLSWNGADETLREVVSLFEYLEGKNLALIPDDSDMADVYCCKLTGDIEKKHWFKDRWHFSITLEEV